VVSEIGEVVQQGQDIRVDLRLAKEQACVAKEDSRVTEVMEMEGPRKR
jgi:hypothetical protein